MYYGQPGSRPKNRLAKALRQLRPIRQVAGAPVRAPRRRLQPQALVVQPRPPRRRKPAYAGIGRRFADTVLGRGAGAFLGEVFGSGAYRTKMNSLIQGPPRFQLGKEGVEIVHREFIADVTSQGAAFSKTVYPINPGLPQLFPYLQAVAGNFEQYEMLGMLVEFKSTSATAVASTNTALGAVIIGTMYDPLDPTFTTKQQMESYEYTTSCAPSASMVHPIECAPSSRQVRLNYIRTGAVPAGGDIRLYDVGNLVVATQGQQAVSVVGELWISYHIRLVKPRIPVPLGSNLPVGSFTMASVTNASPTGALFSFATRTGSNLGVLWQSGTTLIVPAIGRYYLTYVASAVTSYTKPATLLVDVAGESAVVKNISDAGSTTAACALACTVDVSTINGRIQFGLPTIVGACTVELTIVQVSSSLDIA